MKFYTSYCNSVVQTYHHYLIAVELNEPKSANKMKQILVLKIEGTPAELEQFNGYFVHNLNELQKDPEMNLLISEYGKASEDFNVVLGRIAESNILATTVFD